MKNIIATVLNVVNILFVFGYISYIGYTLFKTMKETGEFGVHYEVEIGENMEKENSFNVYVYKWDKGKIVGSSFHFHQSKEWADSVVTYYTKLNETK